MDIKKSTFRFLAGSLVLMITGCVPFSFQNNTTIKHSPPVAAEHPAAAPVPPHPVKKLAKAPPAAKKKFFLFNMKYDDVWERIRNDFRLDHDINNPRVQAHIRWFQKHPEYVERVTKRASPYIYLIVEELDRRNMPKEVALLPMIESGFNPIAYSPMKAAGLWQMMPETARGFGIEINNYYDGRRDIYAATNSALDYLSKLSNDYDGDWELVFAAYNTGPGNINKAIENNRRQKKATDYWSLPVANETREYVPRLIALCHVIKHAENYGINLPKVENKPHVQMVNVGKQISLDLAAQLANMSLPDLKKYNPGYTSWATSPNGPHLLMLPKSSAEKFTTNLATLPNSHRLGITPKNNTGSTLSTAALTKIYAVKPGDSVYKIAKQFGVSQNDLLKWNKLTNNSTLRIGQKLRVG